MAKIQIVVVGAVLTCFMVSIAIGQGRPDPAQIISSQKESMTKLSAMDGVWRGTAWTVLPSGEKHTLVQTERIGPFLDGSIKVVEGRGYEPDGKVAFNSFGTISYNPAKEAYMLHSYAMGNVGDFVLTLTSDGFYWEIPAGPMTIRYTATIKDGTWHEVGDRIIPGQDPVRFHEMNLKRISDTNWPAAGEIGPK